MQNTMYELIAELYPCLVFDNKPYQSNVLSEYEKSVIESKNSWGEGVNSKAFANVDTN